MTAGDRTAPALLRALVGWVLGGLLLVGVVLAPPASADTDEDTSAAQTWSVQPGTAEGADDRAAWELELTPGEQVTDYAQVNNFGDEPLILHVYSHDAINTAEGAFTLQPADVQPTEVGAWIGLDEEITVAAGESEVLPFTITVPEDASPGDHAGGILASVRTDATDEEGQQVVVDNRVGSRVYLRVAGELDPRLQIEDVQVDYGRSWLPLTTGTARVSYTVVNVGNIRLTGSQSITAAGPFGWGEHSATLHDLPEILPGESFRVTEQLDEVPPLLRMSETVAVNPEPAAPTTEPVPTVQASATTGFWAVPWVELIIIAVLVLVIVWSRFARRRRRRRTKATIAAAVAQARKEAKEEVRKETAAGSGNGSSSAG